MRPSWTATFIAVIAALVAGCSQVSAGPTDALPSATVPTASIAASQAPTNSPAVTTAVSPAASGEPSSTATAQASPATSASSRQNGSVDFDGLTVTTPLYFDDTTSGLPETRFTSLPIFANTREDAAALVVVTYHYIDASGQPLDIPIERTLDGQTGLLIPPGLGPNGDDRWYGFSDVIVAGADKTAAAGVVTEVESVSWLQAIQPGYTRLFRTGAFDQTCRNDAKIGCAFTNPNAYPVAVVPMAVLCYQLPENGCSAQGYFWNGKRTVVEPNSSEMLTLTAQQAADLGSQYDSLPPEQDGNPLIWSVRYWLTADQPNWPMR